ncbi:helix-turn-helix domain-containing protein [Streptomyces vietnamensis]|uniref:helix-turn-helix domain-containing protein n=1 Tax=Streptomyces vietnamensis TaxID=362257 RepID=UPI0037974049
MVVSAAPGAARQKRHRPLHPRRRGGRPRRASLRRPPRVHPGLSEELERTVLAGLQSVPPQERRQLTATFAAWRDAGGSTTRAAAVLHCHRNTVANRLERLTGRSLAHPGRPGRAAPRAGGSAPARDLTGGRAPPLAAAVRAEGAFGVDPRISPRPSRSPRHAARAGRPWSHRGSSSRTST